MTSLTQRIICCTPVFYDDDFEDHDAERVWEENRSRNRNRNIRGRTKKSKLDVLTGQNRRAVSLSRKSRMDNTVMYDSSARSVQRSVSSGKKKRRSKSLGAMVRKSINKSIERRIEKNFG